MEIDEIKIQYRKDCRDYKILDLRDHLEQYKFCDNKKCEYKSGDYDYGSFCKYKKRGV